MLLMLVGVMTATGLGCGTGDSGGCPAGVDCPKVSADTKSAMREGFRLEDEVAVAVYGPGTTGLPMAYTPEEVTRLSMVTRPRSLQVQADSAGGADTYVLSSGGGNIFVDDYMTVSHNGSEIFRGPGPLFNSGTFGPVSISGVVPGDTIGVQVINQYCCCEAMSALTLTRQSDGEVIWSAPGIGFNCPGVSGLIFNETIIIPGPSPEPTPTPTAEPSATATPTPTPAGSPGGSPPATTVGTTGDTTATVGTTDGGSTSETTGGNTTGGTTEGGTGGTPSPTPTGSPSGSPAPSATPKPSPGDESTSGCVTPWCYRTSPPLRLGSQAMQAITDMECHSRA